MQTNEASSQTILPVPGIANGHGEEKRAEDLVAERATENLSRWKAIRATGDASGLPSDQLYAWVVEDVKAYRSLDARLAPSLQKRIAENGSVYPPYAEALARIDADLAACVKPDSELIGLANFIAETVNLQPERMAERILMAEEGLALMLSNATTMTAMAARIEEHLSWIPQRKINDVHAAIATILGREDAAERSRIAREGHAVAALEAEHSRLIDPVLKQKQVSEVADFIAANKGLLSWKVIENIANADEPLKAVLADEKRMSELDSQVNERLDGINPLFVGDVQAIIANALGRPDAAARMQRASTLHKEHDRVPRPLAEIPPIEERPHLTESTVREDASHSSSAQHEIVEPSPDPPDGDFNPGFGAGGGRLAGDELSRQNPGEPVAEIESAATDEDAEKRDRRNIGLATESPIAPASPFKGNGIAPGVPGTQRETTPAIGNLLERMTYRTQKDGRVLYLLDDRPAFLDHGDQLMMASGADQDERAIIAAVLMAKEKYNGAFEFTGDVQFKRRAIEVMLKYRVEARLKSPEQEAIRRELSAGAQEKYIPGTPSSPVLPVELKPRSDANDSGSGGQAGRDVMPRDESADLNHSATLDRVTRPPVPSNTPSPPNAAVSVAMTADFPAEPLNRLAGKVQNHGRAPYDHVTGNRDSYFVELENADGRVRTIWGVDLARACDKAMRATRA